MMDSSNWLLALLNTGAFLLCVGFLVYVIVIMRPYLSIKELPPGDAADNDWHLIVPALNEEEVIGGTVLHLTSTFPQAHVWVIDDGSDDATGRVLAELAPRLPKLHVITRVAPDARTGKGDVLNLGWSSIDEWVTRNGGDKKKTIVGVVDADGRLDPHAFDVISGEEMFADATVGAVQVLVRVVEDVEAFVSTDVQTLASRSALPAPGDASILVQLQDMEFTGPIAAMQGLRRRTGSVGMGGNGQFTRLSVLNEISKKFGTPWHGALLEDFELGLHVLLMGYRTEYCHHTFVAQAGLDRLRPLIRQRSRWSQGGIQCLKYLWAVMQSRNVSLSGALEIAYYLYVPWSQLSGSIIFPAAIGIDIWYALNTGGGTDRWWMTGAWGIVPLALLFGVFPHAVWGLLYRTRCGNMITRRRALALAMGNLLYGYLLQAAVWWALIRIIRGKTDWKKTKHPGTRVGMALAQARTPDEWAAEIEHAQQSTSHHRHSTPAGV
ncbi:glycosyltransferase family 2 protein [Catenuloplanes indicus]|uniref:Cellulose synthase/poly-beta-1,6-N-acetylglucosamine synthase-like glycosyltransferase n=1 Tax=Catenuloplanes indicus TaxID=137267 RepID=A0AAE4AXD2_9ACTN|nr:glycosyltransferase [Catenuloplanes indicus]MDQ0366062.1 cellulose synthase/poly-beta-1,6-N-acetylglucosamine synthase-like glycosyltransferase [Catenuloplanes indicus]